MRGEAGSGLCRSYPGSGAQVWAASNMRKRWCAHGSSVAFRLQEVGSNAMLETHRSAFHGAEDPSLSFRLEQSCELPCSRSPLSKLWIACSIWWQTGR